MSDEDIYDKLTARWIVESTQLGACYMEGIERAVWLRTVVQGKHVFSGFHLHEYNLSDYINSVRVYHPQKRAFFAVVF